MPITIDEFSSKSLYLETYLNSQQLGIATGFVVKSNEHHYLITNWHVVTGRNPDDNQPLFRNGAADPNTMKIWFHAQPLGNWQPLTLNLIDTNGDKQWLEHPLGNAVDVVGILLTALEGIIIYDIDLSLANFDLMLYPSESVSIIGFPEGLTSGGRLPIWKTGHIASDIDIDWNGKPAFLIDATTKGGMSGSPVIAKRISIYQTSTGNRIGNAVRFLGVYSGREISASGIEIGFVWKPRVIAEIISN